MVQGAGVVSLITCEDDVRAWVREASGGKARWVEPALGSTPGLPDCWVPWGDSVVWIELKCGRMKEGLVKYSVRPEQAKQIREMANDGVKVGLLVGIKGARMLLFCRPAPVMLRGEWSICNDYNTSDWFAIETGSRSMFWEGVNFIVS